MKNMLDVLIGSVSYWAIGWGLAYGEGRVDYGNVLFCLICGLCSDYVKYLLLLFAQV